MNNKLQFKLHSTSYNKDIIPSSFNNLIYSSTIKNLSDQPIHYPFLQLGLDYLLNTQYASLLWAVPIDDELDTDEVFGYCLITKGYIISLYTKSLFRRQGIARALLNEALFEQSPLSTPFPVINILDPKIKYQPRAFSILFKQAAPQQTPSIH